MKTATIKPLNFFPVSSSQIKGYHYDKKKSELFLKFRNQDIWKYSNVESDEFNEFIRAESLGRYFHQNIRDKKPSIKCYEEETA